MFGMTTIHIPIEVGQPDGVVWCPHCYWFSGIEGPILVVPPGGRKPIEFTRYGLCLSCETELSCSTLTSFAMFKHSILALI